MTLVFARHVEGPSTHAFVVGCGRYPHFAPNNAADRRSPVAGAVAMGGMLIQSRDALVAPLASVEMLVSDPADRTGPADISVRLPGLASETVDPADAAHFQAAGDAWLDRVQPGDTVIFYFSGHGVVDRTGGAVGLLEDIKARKKRPWSASFSVLPLISALSTISAASAWVFFDACQEIAGSLAEIPWSVGDLVFKEVTLDDLQNESCEPLAIAGARVGQMAWAPDGYEPPYFTQVLLKGLSGCCVEKTRGHGWAVTGQSLLFDLKEIGRTIIDAVEVSPQSLAPFSERKTLVAVAEPFTPIAVRSSPEMHLRMAASVRVMDGASIMHSSDEPRFVWRVDVPIVDRDLTVECTVRDGAAALMPETFRPEPPSHNIVLVLAGMAP